MSVASDQFDSDLAHAFEILLGRPLDTFDPKSTYVLYHWDDAISAELFDCLEDTALLGSTISGLTLCPEDSPLSPGQWNFDLGRSLFVLDRAESFGQPAAAALREASLNPQEITVTGVDFASVLADLDGPPEVPFLAMLARVETTGTLVDALRAATWTMNGPEGLDTDEAEGTVEPHWEQALAEIADPDLRHHLGRLCYSAQSARSDGAYYSGPDRCPAEFDWLANLPGHTFVTGWEFGEGQASTAIIAVDSSHQNAR